LGVATCAPLLFQKHYLVTTIASSTSGTSETSKALKYVQNFCYDEGKNPTPFYSPAISGFVSECKNTAHSDKFNVIIFSF
jgi:hypothetical protein